MEYPDLLIESKTMSLDEVKAALDRTGYDGVETASDGTPAPHAPPEPASSPVPSPAPGPSADGAGEDETGAASETAQPELQPKPQGGFKKKITRLQSENDALRRQLEELKSSAKPPDVPVAPSEAKPPEAQPKPKWEDFADSENQMESYTEALTDWKLSEKDRLVAEAKQTERTKAEQDQQRARAEADSKERMDRWNAQLAEARETYSDFDAVTVESATAVPMSGAMITAMFDSDQGARLAYWLGKHPKESERIAKLTEIAGTASDSEVRRKMSVVYREFAKIEDQLDNPAPAPPAPAPASRETRPAPVTPPAPTTSPAKPTPPPPPPVPVGSRGSAKRSLTEMTAEEIRNMDPAEYRRMRDAGA